ncbi:hypothetical protein BBP40_010627 [Aspergillus hancockii]|nr:hypothetical protein BBP40_010627 [Aspergillus hancockii]
MGSPFRNHLLAEITKRRVAHSARVASWDQKGLNKDAFSCRTVLGTGLIPGCKSGAAMMEIHHTLGLNYEASDPDYSRKVLIKAYPKRPMCSPCHHVRAVLGRKKFGGVPAFNCYLTMLFNKCARIEIENQNDEAYIQYFYIDYELLSRTSIQGHAANSLRPQAKKLACIDKSIILATEGDLMGRRGRYVSLGDDIWPPSMHSMVRADYFQGWVMQKSAYPFCGTVIHEEDVLNYQGELNQAIPTTSAATGYLRILDPNLAATHGPVGGGFPARERN